MHTVASLAWDHAVLQQLCKLLAIDAACMHDSEISTQH